MTKRIGLTYQYALVDDELYEWLNQWKWIAMPGHNTHYASRSSCMDGEQRMVMMHRQVLGLEHGDGKITDHINRNGLDNRRSNLRTVDPRTNSLNHIDDPYLSGCTGVAWNSQTQMWRVHIGTGSYRFNLGEYSSLDDAIKARKKGETDYWHGGYATIVAYPPCGTWQTKSMSAKENVK